MNITFKWLGEDENFRWNHDEWRAQVGQTNAVLIDFWTENSEEKPADRRIEIAAATAGEDYEAVRGTITFTPGHSKKPLFFVDGGSSTHKTHPSRKILHAANRLPLVPQTPHAKRFRSHYLRQHRRANRTI